MVRRGADTPSGSRTGTILDKFGEEQQPVVNDQPLTNEPVSLQLTERKILLVVNSYNKGAVLYFEKNTGKLFELDLETKSEQPVLNKSLVNFISATWSPTRKAFIGSFVSGSGTIFKYFNISTGQEITLDPGIRSVTFSPDGNLIGYHFLAPENSQDQADSPADRTGKIMISEPDGKYPKKILNTRLDGVKLSWPIREKLSLETSTSELFLLDEDGKLSSILEPSFGLDKKWSPSGKKLIFSFSSNVPGQTEQITPVLKIKNIESREERILTEASASKCAWSIDDFTVFCAIPKSPSVDEIYQINTLDGSRKLVAEPLMSIREILLSPLEEQIMFVSASDEKLYSIKISD